METLNTLNRFRKAGKYCDVTVSAANNKFNVHRNVLAACSPLLDAELTKFSHVQHIKVTLENADSLDSSVLDNVLDYMYTGEITLHEQDIECVCNLAISLKITSLQSKVEKFLNCRLDQNPASFVPTVLLAIQFKDLKLKKTLHECLQIHFSSVSQLDSFQSLTADQLNAVLDYFKDSDLSWAIMFLIFSWIMCETQNRQKYLRILTSNNIKLAALTQEIYTEIKQLETFFSLSKVFVMTFIETLLKSGTLLGPFSDELVTLRQAASEAEILCVDNLGEGSDKNVQRVGFSIAEVRMFGSSENIIDLTTCEKEEEIKGQDTGK